MAATLPLPVLDEIAGALARAPLFERLARADLLGLARLVRARTLEAGDVLFEEGDPADRFYMVQSGTLELAAADGPSAILRPGDTVGERALVQEETQAFTAVARERTNLLVIARAAFMALADADGLAPRLALGFAAALDAQRGRARADALRSVLLPPDSPQSAEFELTGGLKRGADDVTAAWDAMPFKGGGLLYAVMAAEATVLPAGHALVAARALLREIASSEERFERVLTRLGRALHGGAAAAASVGLIHVGHVLTFALAGACGATIARADGEWSEIEPHGPPAGATSDAAYATTRAEMETGDVAVLLSRIAEGSLAAAAQEIRAQPATPLPALGPRAAAVLSHDERCTGAEVAFVIARRT